MISVWKLADSEDKRENQETTKEVESQERTLLERSAGYRVRKNWGFPGNQFSCENVSPLPMGLRNINCGWIPESISMYLYQDIVFRFLLILFYFIF